MMMSCELKLRTLAQQNTTLTTALTFPPNPTIPNGTPQFLWFDRQLAQGDIGKPSDNRTAVTVRRIATQRTPFANQGGPVQNLSMVRVQVDVYDYNAERGRTVASQIANWLKTVSLLDPGEFSSPQTGPSQNPNFLLNERAGMLPQVQPPVYVETQDWRIWNNENVPSS